MSGLFGQPSANAGGGSGSSLFGQAAKPIQVTGPFGVSVGTGQSSLFGQPTTNTQQQQPGGGTGGGGLFGQPSATQQQQQTGTTGGGLFGQSTNTQQQGTAGAGGLFGQSTQQQQGNTGGGGLFGQSTQQQQGITGGGLFGSKPAATAGGGLFGSSTQQQQPAAPTSGLFGTSALGGKPAMGTGLFGQSTTQGLNPALGGSILQQSQNQGNTAAQPQGPAGAYFDSLFAKSQKAGEGKSGSEELPTVRKTLGDVRHRLQKLMPRANDRPLDGKAHYLLAASGVDPSTAVKDLGLLDVQGVRAADRSQGYAPTEVDVETYLSNLQTKTTLDMISDGLDRSVRDFDNFLEDNMQVEWEAQRKRVYAHFGINLRDESSAPGARESQSGFGRSRRSRTQGSDASKSGRKSVFGRSSLQRSVIGAPSRIGEHQSEFSDVDRSAENGTKSRGPEDRATRERQSKLAEKVGQLNAARLLSRPYPVFSELADVEQENPEPHAPHVVEAYRAAMQIVGEDPSAETTINGATAKARQFAEMYFADNPNSREAVEMKNRILHGSTRFLESQFLREVESLVAKYPHEAQLGGKPDITSKIKAYVRLRSARKNLVPDNTELQQVGGEYVWAIVFYLLRSGHANAAAQYVNDNNNQFRGIDRTFSSFIHNYATSEEGRLTSRRLQERCTAEYVQRSRNATENSVDPFRLACYKIIGRIELSNRNLERFNTDINDWIWLQFSLAREVDKTVEMAGESYGLAELQGSIREIAKVFPKSPAEENNGSFGMFFYLQILAGLFEDAIAYLYNFAYIDAVHFALALEFYGLLRPSDPLSGSNDLRTYSTRNLPQINFGRMIGYYTRDFRAANAVAAVDYLALICLNADLGGEAGPRHKTLCHEALKELVLETREFSRLIGDIRPDGRHVRGVIEERSALIGLDGSDLVNTVTLQAASYADENGRTTDSVLLYHLAGEYDTVVSIVSRALSEAVALDFGEDPMRLKPTKPRAAANDAERDQQGTTLNLAAIDDPIELARTMMRMYEGDAMFYRKIQDSNKVACRVLLEMSQVKKMVEEGKWAQSIDKIRSLGILPLDAKGDPSLIRTYASRFASLSQPVSINVSNLLAWTVLCCIKQRETEMSGQFSGNEGARREVIESIRGIVLDLTTYTSQLRYRFPPGLHEMLARAGAEC